jgi:hypothetical protein
LTTLLSALISLWATTACLPAWWTGCDHSASTIMRRCQNVGELTGSRLLWDRHTEAYSPIPQESQFGRWLCWEVV